MNPWNRIGALIAKEFRHLGRDRRTLAVVLATLVLMILFAYAISFNVKGVSTIVIDQDRPPASAAYLRNYAARTSSTSSAPRMAWPTWTGSSTTTRRGSRCWCRPGSDAAWPLASRPPSWSTWTATNPPRLVSARRS